MLLKTILIFLAAMALVALVGKAIARASGRKPLRLGVAKAAICPQCGRKDVAGAILGRRSCGCGSK